MTDPAPFVPQGSPEWFAARLGKATASRIADLAARTKSGYGASRANYLAELVVERLTGQPAERYQNEAMRWGTEQEPAARAAYEFMADAEVGLCGFIPHPAIADAGASPDGLIGADGLIEIKCPGSAVHIETLLGAPIADRYLKQMQFQMACAERAWCAFVSFDPRMPPAMQLFIQRVPRDEATIAALEAETRTFLDELAAKVAALEARYGAAAEQEAA